jgi:hypothetical protein
MLSTPLSFDGILNSIYLYVGVCMPHFEPLNGLFNWSLRIESSMLLQTIDHVFSLYLFQRSYLYKMSKFYMQLMLFPLYGSV